MTFQQLTFKIATQLIQERLRLPQTAEPADIAPQGAGQQFGGSVLSLLGKKNPTGTATEPGPKVVTDTGKQPQ